ncbi:hypothetical protein EZS27_007933 [termite gut metagenome]|uniref:Uncharacterized protein n=1 Tax=termite gut metagenome TaxID=433724 RepID=A0A5J4SEW9_9ZZZZ
MLDLDKLARMLDEALAKETPESLNRWYNEQVMLDMEGFLDDVVLKDSLHITGTELYITSAKLEHAAYHAKTENESDVTKHNYILAA